MSGVGITGLIEPLNGGAFPVFEDINGKGGLRSVASIAARNSFSAAPLFCKEGMLVYVSDTKCYYSLGADLATWGFVTSNQQEIAKQTTWVINGVTGSDNNTGLASGTALATAEELSRRLCPGGSRLDISVAAVTVTFQANGVATSYGKVQLNLSSSSTSTRVFTLQSEFNSSANITIATSVSANPTTGARSELTSLSSLFVAKKRLRNTTAGARLGGLAVASNLNGAATDVFVGTNWQNPITGTAADPVVGDTVTVDTLLVTFNTVEITSHTGVNVLVQDSILTRSFFQTFSSAGSLTSNPFIWGCETSPTTVSNVLESYGGMLLLAVRFNFACVIAGDYCNVAGVSVQAAVSVYSKNFVASASADNIIDAGSVTIGGLHAEVFCKAVISGRFEHENGSGLTAWTLQFGSALTAANSMWGAGGYATGFSLTASTHVESSVSYGVAGGINFGSTTNFSLSGKSVSYAQCPINYNLLNCGALISSASNPLPQNDAEINDGNSGAAVTVDFTKGALHLVTLTANATATLVAPAAPCTVTLRLVEGGTGTFTLTLAGLTVKGYTALAVTTAGAQNVLTFYWTGAQMLLTSQVGYA